MNVLLVIFEQLESVLQAGREVLSANIKMAERIRSENKKINQGMCLIKKNLNITK
jgi:hypothetical protein